MPNVIQWYENKALDDPKLRSPTPCPRGIYCQYKIPNPETQELEIACCRMVHPGEEGNGRRLFPARTAPDGRVQPTCARLTGNAGFYERCRLKQPWRVWAAQHGIPLPPTDVPWVHVQRGPILRRAHMTRLPDVSETFTGEENGVATSAVEWPCLQPAPPPRLNLAGGGPTYGFSSCEALRLPPEIVRQTEGMEEL